MVFRIREVKRGRKDRKRKKKGKEKERKEGAKNELTLDFICLTYKADMSENHLKLR
jgi:hypothetical protein